MFTNGLLRIKRVCNEIIDFLHLYAINTVRVWGRRVHQKADVMKNTIGKPKLNLTNKPQLDVVYGKIVKTDISSFETSKLYVREEGTGETFAFPIRWQDIPNGLAANIDMGIRPDVIVWHCGPELKNRCAYMAYNDLLIEAAGGAGMMTGYTESHLMEYKKKLKARLEAKQRLKNIKQQIAVVKSIQCKGKIEDAKDVLQKYLNVQAEKARKDLAHIR